MTALPRAQVLQTLQQHLAMHGPACKTSLSLRSSTTLRHSGGSRGGLPSQRLQRRRDWLNSGNKKSKSSSIVVEQALPA